MLSQHSQPGETSRPVSFRSRLAMTKTTERAVSSGCRLG